jgi:hypothetical protein
VSVREAPLAWRGRIVQESLGMSLSSAMSAPSRERLRKYVFDSFVGRSRAPFIEEIMQSFELSRAEAAHGLQELEAAHHILLLPGTHRILMANPFSNMPTAFRVSTNSREYFANCAWDAVALHLVLECETVVHSFCHHCGAPIEFELGDEGTNSDGRDSVLVFLGTPVSKWYENLLVTCSNTMVFFRSRTHLVAWQAEHPGEVGEALSVERMIKVVAPISRGRARLDYRMPTKSELMEDWESNGVTGKFWTF